MNQLSYSDALLQDIGTQLYRIRQTRNEKLTSVARAINTSHSVISEIENGRYRSLSLGLLTKLVTYYGVSVDVVICAN